MGNAPTLPPPATRSRILVCGKTGYGKTFWLRAHLKAWQQMGVRIVAIDPKDELSRCGAVKGGPLRQRCTLRELGANPGLLQAPRLSLAIAVGRTSAIEGARAFELLMILALRSAPLCVVLSEVGFWADPSPGGDEGKAAARARAQIGTMAALYRGDGVSMVFDTQRAVDVPPKARAQLSDVIAFRQDLPADRAAILEATQDERFSRVSDLPEFHALHWSDSHSRTRAQDTAQDATH